MLRELVIAYLKAECDNPNPTEEDIAGQIQYGVEVFGSEEGLLTSLKYYFGHI
jgi:hypothetical protein